MDAIDLGSGPRLLHLVLRCAQVDAQAAALRAAGFDPGAAIAASRETPQGRVEWRITVREDGRLLCGGALPTLIEWGPLHPTDSMPTSGVSLRALTLRGLPEAAVQALPMTGIECATGSGPALRATLDTPLGRVTLHSH